VLFNRYNTGDYYAKFERFSLFEVEFNKDGTVHDQNQAKALMDFLGQGSVSDLFVISHGWNNDMADARGLYSRFFECMRAVINLGTVGGISTRNFAVLAVLWPQRNLRNRILFPVARQAGLSYYQRPPQARTQRYERLI